MKKKVESDFDPYLRWLGIRDKQRPPNHYRLLGLELFEDDTDIIATAADRQMSHVRTYQSGRHALISQKLLNELATAVRRTLRDLVHDRKAAGTLRQFPPGNRPPSPPGPIPKAFPTQKGSGPDPPR